MAFLNREAQPESLALVNGFLIDGTGTAPIEHAVLVIEGGKGRAGGNSGKCQNN